MRYVLDFGSANTGGAPAFSQFKNADTLAVITPPAVAEVGSGLYYFDWNWTSTTATSILYKISLAGVELSDVIRSDQVTTGAVTPGAGAGVNSWLWTAGQIINMAAVEAGLAEVADPYASSDPKFIQLRTLLKSAGMEIAGLRDWTVLVKEATIAGDGVTTTFALPADFLRLKEESGHDRTSRMAFAGPTSSQKWQRLKALGVAPSLRPLYRVQQGKMIFFEAVAIGTTLAYEYVSRYWVASDGAASADSYFPVAAGDKVMLEPLMVTRLLKAKFLQAKGFDSAGAFAEYQQAYETAAGMEPAPVLHLGGPGPSERFIDTDNLPSTGYGLP